ncbi:hypothetical protein [Streptosporangium sp. CA-115845]|uniref:hypothetical protein n=1 Tax=Streptosporangium sp. CA-115845 TaxID=3240071 RepID=UPI003D948536
MLMVLWTIRFRDPGVKDVEITAASYNLTHEREILSFFDDRGGEVFACPLVSAAHWAPHVPAFADRRGPVGTVSPVPAYPVGESRQSIEAQAAAAAAAGGAAPGAAGPAGNRLEGRLVAAS